MAGADTETALRSLAPQRVCLVGATGTVGRAVREALVGRGRAVTSLVRRRPDRTVPIAGAEVREVDFADPASLARDGFGDVGFDAVISCMASRTGAPGDAWAVDHRAHLNLLQAAQAAGVSRFVLVSAICVQKPQLAFQHAKLAFEAALLASGLDVTIVRPTALFKSLSGQVERVRRGRPFLVFGDGRLTACKPISDADLADYLVDRLDEAGPVGEGPRSHVLPIGGPGPPITPREQGEMLFALLGRRPRFRQVPPSLLDGVIGALDLAARVRPALADKAELARIGRYYATQSMLVWNGTAGRYDAEATPSTGRETLADHYAALIEGTASVERGEHSVF